MTQAQFNELPMLLTYGQVLDVGVPEKAVPLLVKSKKLSFVRFGPKRRRKYHKIAVARLVGFEI